MTTDFMKKHLKKYNDATVDVDKETQSPDVIPTGVLGLDVITGIGGLPRGRVVELFGDPSTGKSTVALTLVAQAQKRGLPCIYLDLEQALDLRYAKNLGVDINPPNFFMFQPKSGEEGCEIVRSILMDPETPELGVIIIDSVAALTPTADQEKEFETATMGTQARLMSRFLGTVNPFVKRKKPVFLLLNQMRKKIGVMYGSPNTTSGGEALKFYTSIRAEITKGKLIQEGDLVLGHESKIKIVKNKMSPPNRTCEFRIMYGTGVDKLAEVVAWGITTGLITKSGAWFSYKGENIGHGVEKTLEFFRDNPEEYEALKTGVFSANHILKGDE